ncbi:MAG TPA: aminotransferase, partial [Candidatus Thermoplasmatota archaeon]|nr:aminotransferase [Candidatus Thermoplasmatota archaeon]
TQRVAKACRAAAEAGGLQLAADAAVRSDTVTALHYPAGVEDGRIRGFLKDRFGVVVAGAQGQWKGRVFRVGHMAGTTWTEMAACWAALEGAFRLAGSPLKPGVSAALQEFA